MTAKDISEILDGREYRNEVTNAVKKSAKDNGLVIVYGQSDDLCEFEGAITDEISCYEGTTVYLDSNGIVKNECEDDCPYYEKLLKTAKKIKAVWNDSGDPCWSYETDIPHETFNIYDDEQWYCSGIVFNISELSK